MFSFNTVAVSSSAHYLQLKPVKDNQASAKVASGRCTIGNDIDMEEFHYP